jgi:hypothetical protein
MNHPKAHQEYFELNPLFNSKPMEMFKDRGDVVMLLCSAQYPGCWVLDSLLSIGQVGSPSLMSGRVGEFPEEVVIARTTDLTV